MSKIPTETVELHRIPEATDLPLILYRAAVAEKGKAAAKTAAPTASAKKK